MTTDELIRMLSAGAGASPRLNMGVYLFPAITAGALAGILLSGGLLGWVPAHMMTAPALWFKLAYAGTLAVGAGWLVARLARPVSHTRAPRAAITAVLLCVMLVGVIAVLNEKSGARMQAIFGSTWSNCPLIIPALALPALAGLMATLRRLAPTRMREAGFAAGLLAGSLGAIGYSMHCPEESLVFVAIWYTLGMFGSGALGARLGPRLLRW